MVKKLLIISVVMLMAWSCTPTKSEDYAPFAEGNEWTYKIITNDTTETTSIRKVESAVTIGDIGDGWKVKATTDTISAYIYVYKGSDTLFNYVDENGDTLIYWEPLDLSNGTKWEVKNPYNDLATTYEVVGEEDVTVEAGTFAGAKKIKATYTTESITGSIKLTTDYEGYTYKAKGVGVVKGENTVTVIMEDTTGTIDPDTTITTTVSELQSYIIK